VGSRGAERFFAARGQPAAAAEVVARWEDEKTLGRFWASLYAVVDSTFKAHPGTDAAQVAQRIGLRDSLFGVARLTLMNEYGPRLKTVSVRSVERLRLDNAVLMSRRVYLTGLDAFDAVLAREHGDLRRTVADVVSAAKADRQHPFDAIKRLAAGS
jgi:predicted aminopeptidase